MNATRPLQAPDRSSAYPTSNMTARANATMLMLVRNSEIDTAAQSVQELEDKFNKRFGYPWIFLNDEPFTDEFKA